jgi:hypothetical protein
VAKYTKSVDKGANALRKRLAAKIPTTRVGIYGDAAAAEHKESDGATVGEIAASHEFGLGPPQRAFISGTVVRNKDRIEAGLRKVGDAAFRGTVNPRQAMRQFGLGVEGMVKEYMAEGVPPPLSQAYIKRKLKKYPGATKPLIASGQMRASVASELEE